MLFLYSPPKADIHSEMKELYRQAADFEEEISIEERSMDSTIESETVDFFSRYPAGTFGESDRQTFMKGLREIYSRKLRGKRDLLSDMHSRLKSMELKYL